MKSSSLLRTSFGHFSDLFKRHWQMYGWYLLCRVLEFVGLGVIIAGVIAGGLLAPDAVVPLVIILLVAVVVGAFLLETWFTFCLYRSLDEQSKDYSFVAFLGRGKRNYWSTLGKYILLGLMWGVLVFGASFLIQLTEGSGVEEILGLVFIGILVYFGLPFLLTMYEVVIASRWPWSTFLEMRQRLKGMWWRMLGTLFVWAVLAFLIYIVIGGLFGFLFFSSVSGVFENLQATSATTSPLEVLDQLSQLFSAGMLLSVVSGLLVFVVASIVPVYGFFSVYKGVKKTIIATRIPTQLDWPI